MGLLAGFLWKVSWVSAEDSSRFPSGIASWYSLKIARSISILISLKMLSENPSKIHWIILPGFLTWLLSPRFLRDYLKHSFKDSSENVFKVFFQLFSIDFSHGSCGDFLKISLEMSPEFPSMIPPGSSGIRDCTMIIFGVSCKDFCIDICRDFFYEFLFGILSVITPGLFPEFINWSFQNFF